MLEKFEKFQVQNPNLIKGGLVPTKEAIRNNGGVGVS